MWCRLAMADSAKCQLGHRPGGARCTAQQKAVHHQQGYTSYLSCIPICSVVAALAGGGYAVFAGKEVSRALGLMSLEAEDCCGELVDLTPRQLEVLEEWVAKFRGKYHVVGKVWLCDIGEH